MCCEGLIEKFPQLETCCCCCKVSTGSKVIAWLGAIGSLLYVVENIVSAVQILKQDHSGGAVAAIIISMIILAFYFIMALVLLVGLYQEDMGKVSFWLRVSVCLFITLVVVLIASIIILAVSGQGAAALSAGISATIIVLFQLYMISVVKSHYHNMTRSYDSGRA